MNIFQSDTFESEAPHTQYNHALIRVALAMSTCEHEGCKTLALERFCQKHRDPITLADLLRTYDDRINKTIQDSEPAGESPPGNLQPVCSGGGDIQPD